MHNKSVVLTVLERLMLPSILPKQGNVLTMTSLREILRKVDISKEEAAKYKLRPLESGGMQWDPNAEEPATFVFTEAEIYLLKQAAESADKENSVTLNSIDLVNKLRGL
jgi:hypothetical protein